MAKTPKADVVEFDFLKSNFFRVIKADGAFGGIAPTGSLHMALYSERHPLPKKVVHELRGDQLGPEIRDKRESREAIIREVEVDVVLDMHQARAVRDWLTGKLEEFERLAEAKSTKAAGKNRE